MRFQRTSLRPLLLGLLLLTASACGDTTEGAAVDQPWTRIDPLWTSIYDGYLGPEGVASCSRGTTCHAKPEETGSVASKFVCGDQAGCYASLTGSSNLIRPQDIANPSGAPFLAKLRTPGGAGKMPSDSSFVFQVGDIGVLESWISKGANND